MPRCRVHVECAALQGIGERGELSAFLRAALLPLLSQLIWHMESLLGRLLLQETSKRCPGRNAVGFCYEQSLKIRARRHYAIDQGVAQLAE